MEGVKEAWKDEEGRICTFSRLIRFSVGDAALDELGPEELVELRSKEAAGEEAAPREAARWSPCIVRICISIARAASSRAAVAALASCAAASLRLSSASAACCCFILRTQKDRHMISTHHHDPDTIG